MLDVEVWESDSSDHISSTQSIFSGTTQSPCEVGSLLDVSADDFHGLHVGEIVIELFEELTRSEFSKKVGETSTKVEVVRRGVHEATGWEKE